MKQSTIEQVMRKLGSVDFVLSGDHVMTNCVYAPYTGEHKNNYDYNPSAGIKITPGISPYHCFSCGRSGGMLNVVREVGKMAMAKGDITPEEYEELISLVLLDEEDTLGSDISIEGVGVKNIEPVPKEILDSLGTGHEYFISRGITEEEIKEYRLGYVKYITVDNKKVYLDRVILPIIDRNGGIPLVQARVLNAEDISRKNPKYRNYPSGVQKQDYLFGEHLITSDTEYLILVEGMFDVILGNCSLKEHDMYPEYVTVACMGAEVGGKQLDKLKSYGKEVIVALDNDNAGKLGSKKLFKAHWRELVLSKLEYPDDIKDLDMLVSKLGSKVFIDLILDRQYMVELEMSSILKGVSNVHRSNSRVQK